jgi:hypothetical protein
MSADTTDKGPRLFHLTTARNAANILRVGFLDSTARYMTSAEHSGVWLTDDPARVQGAKGDTELVVDLDIGLEELDKFEWKTAGGTYREWLIPADFLRIHLTSLAVPEGGPA